MVEVQCSSCHTRYRVDEQVLPEGTPTFKCSRCGHVFSVEPRKADEAAAEPTTAKPAMRNRPARQEVKTSPVKAPAVKSPAVEPGDPQPELHFAAAPPSAPGGATPEDATEPPATPSANAASGDSAHAPAEQPAGRKPSTADLMARPFKDEPEQPENGENLTFDFNDELPVEHDRAADDPVDRATRSVAGDGLESAPRASARWQVGDDPDLAMPAAATERFAAATTAQGRRRAAAAARGSGPEMLDEDAAPIYNQGVTRSARFFLGLFLLVAGGFAATTFAIHTAPAATLDLLSRLPVIGARFTSPVVPARMVALRNVHAEYRRGRDGRLALVIEGQAENVSATALHTIGIMSRIWTPSGDAVARREIYCGNSLATHTIAQMTTHEIEFFQKLPPPRSFALESTSTCPFVIVFVDPPAQLAHFDIAVTAASPAGADQAAAPVS